MTTVERKRKKKKEKERKRKRREKVNDYSGTIVSRMVHAQAWTKNLKSYDNPFCKNSDGGREKERKKGIKSQRL